MRAGEAVRPKPISTRGPLNRRSLGFLRILLSDFAVSVKGMRLSFEKAVYVAVDECGVVGNPEFPPAARRGRRGDKGEGRGQRSSRYRGWTEPQVIRHFHFLMTSQSCTATQAFFCELPSTASRTRSWRIPSSKVG